MNMKGTEYNSILWNNGTPEGKKQARDQKRTLNYVANIVVLNDPAKPENNGKVFKFRFGKKIYEKINEKVKPDSSLELEGENSFNPYCFFNGANFRLKARNVQGSEPGSNYRSYDLSSFDTPSPLFGGDETKMRAAFEKAFPLVEYKNREHYKSYAELRKELASVMGWDREESQQTHQPIQQSKPSENTQKLNDGFGDDQRSSNAVDDEDDFRRYLPDDMPDTFDSGQDDDVF